MYNSKRMHSALGYLSPIEFEQKLKEKQQEKLYILLLNILSTMRGAAQGRIVCAIMLSLVMVLSSFMVLSYPTENYLDEVEGTLTGVPLVSPEKSGTRAGGKVCVLVESSKYTSLQNELQTYKSDLESEGYTVEIRTDVWADHVQIRNFLINEWQSNGSVGCVIVGNLPYAMYELHNDFDEPGLYCNFPIDLYYTDLDGTWLDNNPPNGIYDNHTESGPTDLEPEIWLGRITIDSAWEDEVKLIGNYLNKTHEYRVGNISLPHKALLYVDDDWAGSAAGWSTDISSLYPDRTVENDVYVTNASDYAQRVQQGYEWIQVHCHANHEAWRHAFMYGDGVKGSGGNFTSWNLSEDGQKCLFTNVFTCGSANYTVPDYLCGWYIFTQTYGLCSVGSAKPGSMLGFQDFYDPLAAGDCIGDAFQSWFSIWAEGDPWGDGWENYARSWFYGMTIIGDPTLSPLQGDINPPANVTGLTVEQQGSDVVLNWESPITYDVDYYNVYRSDVETGPWDVAHIIDTVPFGTNTYEDLNKGQADATLWWYVVRAVDHGGNEEKNTNAVQEPDGSPPITYNIDIPGGPGATGWKFVSFPITASGNVQTVFDDDAWNGEGVNAVKWDMIYWYNTTDTSDHWKSYNKNWAGTQDMPISIDNKMGFWIHITDNPVGGDSMLTIGEGYNPAGETIWLQSGWNLVGYPSLAPGTATDLPGWGATVTKMAYYDDAAPYDIVETTNGATPMTHGNAYWVYSTVVTPWNVAA